MTIHVPIAEALLAGSGLVAGRYRLEKVLGMGGMGYVVSATQVEGERDVARVAIKFMLPDALRSPSLHRRFVREAEAIGRLRSEHVCRLLDTGWLPDGAPFMVMEYLSGEDLEKVVALRGPLPLWETADHALQIVDAIAEAHSHGIIHRDLKPANVFRSWRPDGATVIKVLDFGVAKAADGHHSTATNTVIGSPSFMAPEQIISSKRVDERADVYSIGAVLYFLLTGRPPFEADQLPALCLKVISEDPIPPSALRPDLPPDIDRIVLRCMAREPGQRFDDVAELGLALAPYGPEWCWPLAHAAARVMQTMPVRRRSAPSRGAATVSFRRMQAAGDGFATQLVRFSSSGESSERIRSRRRFWMSAIAAMGCLALGIAAAATLARDIRAPMPRDEAAGASADAGETTSTETSSPAADAGPVPDAGPRPVAEAAEEAALEKAATTEAATEAATATATEPARPRRLRRRARDPRPASESMEAEAQAPVPPPVPPPSEALRPRCAVDDPLCAFGTPQ